MLDAKTLAPYIGFTEEEVKALCEKYGQDFEKAKQWYDGYFLENIHVYNPNAIINLMLWGRFKSYWSLTGTYESILPLINMNFDGLKTAIIAMLSGASVEVKTTSFQNDMVTFRNKNDENSLSCVLAIAYLAAMEYYFMPIREFPTGKGFADYVFFPKTEYKEEMPVLLVELKWNKKAETAIKQIKDKKYVQAISNYSGDILLVGISYDKKSKEHECVIEKYIL